MAMKTLEQSKTENMGANQTQGALPDGQLTGVANTSTHVARPTMGYPPTAAAPIAHAPINGRVTRSNTPSGPTMPPFNPVDASVFPSDQPTGAAAFCSSNAQQAGNKAPSTDEEPPVNESTSKGATKKKTAAKKKPVPKKKVGPPEPPRKAVPKQEEQDSGKPSHVAGAGHGQRTVFVKHENINPETSISPQSAVKEDVHSLHVAVPSQTAAGESARSSQPTSGAISSPKDTGTAVQSVREVVASASIPYNTVTLTSGPAIPVTSSCDGRMLTPQLIAAVLPVPLTVKSHPVLGTFATPKNTCRPSGPNVASKPDISSTNESTVAMGSNLYDPYQLRNKDVLDYYKTLPNKGDKPVDAGVAADKHVSANTSSNTGNNTNAETGASFDATDLDGMAWEPAPKTPTTGRARAQNFTSSRMVLNEKGVPIGRCKLIDTTELTDAELFETFTNQDDPQVQSAPPSQVDAESEQHNNINDHDSSNLTRADRAMMPQINISMRPTESGPNPVPGNYPVLRNDSTLLECPEIDPEDFAAFQRVRQLFGQPMMTLEELNNRLRGWDESNNSANKN
ncbi:Fc.00g009300.m01.CDS01 [Cosmosporella sp. VM-42]